MIAGTEPVARRLRHGRFLVADRVIMITPRIEMTSLRTTVHRSVIAPALANTSVTG